MILAIYGAGAMGREAKRAADQMKEPYNIVFIDDNPELKEWLFLTKTLMIYSIVPLVGQSLFGDSIE